MVFAFPLSFLPDCSSCQTTALDSCSESKAAFAQQDLKYLSDSEMTRVISDGDNGFR